MQTQASFDREFGPEISQWIEEEMNSLPGQCFQTPDPWRVVNSVSSKSKGDKYLMKFKQDLRIECFSPDWPWIRSLFDRYNPE